MLYPAELWAQLLTILYLFMYSLSTSLKPVFWNQCIITSKIKNSPVLLKSLGAGGGT
ncbi:hypothetical protein Q428_12555 [Fervidicella metallireducens AeB]|uniref:Uncharacterized protein n=1 Tax=Fervidicella metallireducens AeB TaxID=1403537 RepID=A0A017RS63_9CLOT|nr:hypothetical protein Q428_12555 [Fervidicella metallireducens AeB]